MSREIRTVLVANRGEIARRVLRSARALGLRTVAVYSDADADAAHVREADTAVRLGPAPAAQSYLDIDAVVAAAVATGADVVHPGYGFLSENPAFGRALAAAGIAFAGPGEHALDVMADKITAKHAVGAAGVPTTPGVAEPGLDDETLISRAAEVGYPLLIKPSAGGGGQGMVEVHRAEDLPTALASARRTARNAFGDDTLFLERLVASPRHIEVQVLADAHGSTVYLGERECSLQRRHQKVIEEAPAPLLAAQSDGGSALRARLGEAAVAAARSVRYTGAGTVEFLVSDQDPDEFFFMEMNTRLQVEHPVTEEVVTVAGERLDLVAWQLRIAAGEELGFTQEDVAMHGHAIEARVYAERPEADFLPAVGMVHAVRFPSGPGVRVDAALDGPGEISPHYDPMIAKIIASGADRSEALRRLDRALADTLVAGEGTNLDYLRRLLADPDVVAGHLDTGLIGRREDLTSLPEPDPATLQVLRRAAAALEIAAASPARATGLGSALPDAGRPGSAAGPGWVPDGFLAGAAPAEVSVLLEVDGLDAPDEARVPAPQPGLEAGAGCMLVTAGGDGVHTLWLQRDGRTTRATAVLRAERTRRARAVNGVGQGKDDPRALAPMTGTVAALSVTDGQRVSRGDALVVIEAMKMEHPVTAGADGTVSLRVGVGDLVQQGALVVLVDADQDTTPTTDPTEENHD